MQLWSELLSGPKKKVHKTSVAIVYVDGPIALGSGSASLFGGTEGAYSSDLRRALDKAAADDTIKAVVLRVDSPGGSGFASELIRRELELDAGPFRACLEDPALRKAWGPLKGDAVRTAPKGFDKNHPNLDLIRHKQFIFTREFDDRAVVASDFMDVVNDSFKAVRPWFDLMSEILTTDLNGRSLLDE